MKYGVVLHYALMAHCPLTKGVGIMEQEFTADDLERRWRAMHDDLQEFIERTHAQLVKDKLSSMLRSNGCVRLNESRTILSMFVVKKDDPTITWDSEAMANRPFKKGVVMKTLLLAAVFLSAAPAFAQLGIEVTPGVTFYGGPNGGTVGVETMPGVRFYSGEVEGSAMTIMPGVTDYNLRPAQGDRFSREVGESAVQFSRDLDRQRAQDARDRRGWGEGR